MDAWLEPRVENFISLTRVVEIERVDDLRRNTNTILATMRLSFYKRILFIECFGNELSGGDLKTLHVSLCRPCLYDINIETQNFEGRYIICLKPESRILNKLVGSSLEFQQLHAL